MLKHLANKISTAELMSTLPLKNLKLTFLYREQLYGTSLV